MTTSDGPLVSELSEEELLARIFPLLPAGADTLVPPGDDAAVVAAPDGRFVVTTDVLVEDRHFRRVWSSGEDVGRRAAVQNLADVAAMGARPTSLVVALVIPADLPVSWVEGLARGLAPSARRWASGSSGGDLSGGPGRGRRRDRARRPRGTRTRAAVRRATGRRRRARRRRRVVGGGPRAARAGRAEPGRELVDAYLHPASPLAAGPAAAVAGATAMLDVSDGLLRDAGRLARASGVVVDLAAPATRSPRRRAARRRGRGARRGRGTLGARRR